MMLHRFFFHGACVLLLLTLGLATARAQRVTFAVLGDSQFDNPAVFERMIHEVNLLQPEFVVQVGDMIQGYTYHKPTLRDEWVRFQREIAPLEMPFYPVAGNHDVITPESEEIYGEVWGLDRYYYAFDWEQTHHIVLNTDFQGQAEQIGPQQREWLEHNLARFADSRGALLADSHIFVYLHRPIFHSWPDDWAELHDLLRRYPVRMVLAGHTHHFSWEERDGIQYIVLNSAGAMWTRNERAGRFHGFYMVTVDDDKITPAIVKAGSILPADTVTRAEHVSRSRLLQRDGTVVVQAAMGDPFDATVSVPIYNYTAQDREYTLRWGVPIDSPWHVAPTAARVHAPPGGTQVDFHLRTAAVSMDLAPECRVSTMEVVRSGVVPLAWERRLHAATDEQNIALDAPTPFEHVVRLHVPPRASAQPRQGALRIDGHVDEPAWSAAEPLMLGPDEAATLVRFLYDDEALHVGAVLDEPNPAGLRADATGPIALTWSDDDFELFLDPGATRTSYHRLFVNCANTRFSSRPAALGPSLYDATHESAVHIGPRYWSVEYRIPWEMLGRAAPQPGEQWGLNVWRHRTQDPRDPRHQWSEMENFPYQPERFGLLVFE